MKKMHFDVLFYPGTTMSKSSLASLTGELRSVASECFSDVPFYQALTGKKEELDRVVIATARDSKGTLLGFCSAIVLDVEDFGNVLHLGLTCVSPRARGKKLTHKLTSRLLTKYLIKEAPIGGTWISNCACVLSSLGNVAQHFEEIYPSPFSKNSPGPIHLHIARTISKKFRDPIAINEDAVFNEKTFIFEGSVQGAVFEKSATDKRFYHRDPSITNFYLDLINFERGDEVLQVGKISLFSWPKYVAAKSVKRLKRFTGTFGNRSGDYITEL